jgi:hypothetical protein
LRRELRCRWMAANDGSMTKNRCDIGRVVGLDSPLPFGDKCRTVSGELAPDHLWHGGVTADDPPSVSDRHVRRAPFPDRAGGSLLGGLRRLAEA